MRKKSVPRAVLAIGGLAGVVAISACSPASIGAPTTSQPAAAAQVSSSTGPAHIYFPLCGGPNAGATRSKIEPTSLMFSCDTTLGLVDAHWSSWNSDHAQGTGVLEENDCTPSCAEDVLARNKVTVRFDKPVKQSCGVFWTEAVFTYVGRPVGVVHSKPQWTFRPGDPSTYC